MEVLTSFSEKGNIMLLVNGVKFYKTFKLKNGEIHWSCGMRNCKAKVNTDKNYKVIYQNLCHNHSVQNLNLVRQCVYNAVKKIALQDTSVAVKALVKKELSENPELSNILSDGDVKRIIYSLYRARMVQRKSIGNLNIRDNENLVSAGLLPFHTKRFFSVVIFKILVTNFGRVSYLRAPRIYIINL